VGRVVRARELRAAGPGVVKGTAGPGRILRRIAPPASAAGAPPPPR
jgi:hypothetical protein